MAFAFFAASCQQEKLEPELAGGNTVTYTVQIPNSTATRAIGDQISTQDYKVYYEVYRANEVETGQPVYEGSSPVLNNNQASFSLDFIKNQNFVVLFWAQSSALVNTDVTSEEGMYNINDLRKIQLVNPGAANNDAAQVFAGRDVVKNCASAANGNVTLTRPVSQINVYTTTESLSFGRVNIGLSTSDMTVTGLYNTYNVNAGDAVEADENKETFAYTATAVPTVAADNADLTYVAMNYVGFAPKMGTNVKVDFTITTTTETEPIVHKISNVPVKPNFRTNISGNLITASVGYNVSLDKWSNAEITHATNTEAAQAALDCAVKGAVIQLHPGVQYGTLYLRPVEGQENTITDCDYLVYRNEMLRTVEDLTILGAPGATVDAIKVVAGYVENSGSTGYVVNIKNLVINSVEFTDNYVNPPHSYSAPLFFDLTYTNVNGLTVKNCKLIGDNANMNFVYFYGSGNPANSTFVTAAKNITIENNTVDGIARLCELRQAENVTIKGNTIKNTALHGMQLSVDGGTYSGTVTISGNNADGINNRFVRMAGAGDAVVRIENNTITNYKGADADYIKVTDGNNVTIENNTLASRTVPANNTEDVVLNTETIEVTVPAESAEAGATYKVVVSNENTETDATTGETTVGFDLTMYKNDVKVSGDVIYEVTKNLGAGLIISEVTHNGTALMEANTGADQTYAYDSATGVLTIYTKSFSPFKVTYIELSLEETFADNTWNNIILACQNNAVPTSWNVGDKKAMTIGGSEYQIAIIGKNHDAYTAGGKAPLTFQVAEVCGTAKMNETQTNTTGWSGSAMRNTTMPEILKTMPSEVQKAIKAVNKETLNGTRDGLETTSDKLFLLSEIEVNGSVFFSNNFAEGTRYAYYANGGSQIMGSTWWLRGPGKSNDIGYTQIITSGYMANGSAEYACGIVFGFCF